MPPQKTTPPKAVEAFTYDDATRKNIPTAEFQSVMEKSQQSPLRAAYERRNRDLDPQLVWRGSPAGSGGKSRRRWCPAQICGLRKFVIKNRRPGDFFVEDPEGRGAPPAAGGVLGDGMLAPVFLPLIFFQVNGTCAELEPEDAR